MNARMNNEQLGAILKKKLEKLEGEPGFWNAPAGQLKYYIITDEKHDRMRIMIPVDKIGKNDTELALKLLEANFDRALDAKYAIRDGVIWSTFLHPLSSLTEEALDNALKQVRALAENTGTTFSSSDLRFGGDKKEQQDK